MDDPGLAGLLTSNRAPTAQETLEICGMLATGPSHLAEESARLGITAELRRPLNGVLSAIRTFPAEILGPIFLFCRDGIIPVDGYGTDAPTATPMVLGHVSSLCREPPSTAPNGRWFDAIWDLHRRLRKIVLTISSADGVSEMFPSGAFHLLLRQYVRPPHSARILPGRAGASLSVLLHRRLGGADSADRFPVGAALTLVVHLPANLAPTSSASALRSGCSPGGGRPAAPAAHMHAAPPPQPRHFRGPVRRRGSRALRAGAPPLGMALVYDARPRGADAPGAACALVMEKNFKERKLAMDRRAVDRDPGRTEKNATDLIHFTSHTYLMVDIVSARADDGWLHLRFMSQMSWLQAGESVRLGGGASLRLFISVGAVRLSR
ncbi:hypothetical protein DFH09DRAFT_1080184 [Mycena vulgaris]|nr:hypothetical protein DFH09DRAFT_1080184 [Mycena vulgaris]